MAAAENADEELSEFGLTGFVRDQEGSAVLQRASGSTMLLVSDQPMQPEGVKTAASDEKITQQFLDKHLRIGIDSLHQLINRGLTVKHLRF